MRAKQFQRGILISFLLLLIFWFLWLICGLAGKAQVAINEAQNAGRQYQALEERRAALEASIAALETERGKDAAIRTSFGVAKPGEEVIVVVPPAAATTSTTTSSWWQQLFSWF